MIIKFIQAENVTQGHIQFKSTSDSTFNEMNFWLPNKINLNFTFQIEDKWTPDTVKMTPMQNTRCKINLIEIVPHLWRVNKQGR